MTSAQTPLDKIIDAVAESYSAGREIDSLESAALPNRRKVVEALHHLEHAIFLGFYTTKRLSPGTLRSSLAEHLHMHVVPRWSGDANFITIIGGSKVVPQLLRETRELLATAWANQP